MIQIKRAYEKPEKSDGSVFLVNDEFPRIVESSFISPPDHRITGIRYSLQLTGLEILKIEDITQKLGILSGMK